MVYPVATVGGNPSARVGPVVPMVFRQWLFKNNAVIVHWIAGSDFQIFENHLVVLHVASMKPHEHRRFVLVNCSAKQLELFTIGDRWLFDQSFRTSLKRFDRSRCVGVVVTSNETNVWILVIGEIGRGIPGDRLRATHLERFDFVNMGYFDQVRNRRE